MKKVYCISVVFFCLMVQIGAQVQSLPASSAILAPMQLANAYFMKKWPDAGKTVITNKERPSNLWTRAVYYEGLMSLYAIDQNPAYYDYAVQWGEKHNWGLWGGTHVRNADNQCAGQTYIDLYLLDKKEERIRDIKNCMDNMVQSDKRDDWSWVDAIQMAMPVLARLGSIYQDTSYFHTLYDMYAFTKYKHGGKGLYDPKNHLWWRDKDFVFPAYREPNDEGCYWSRGNGWVLAALVRTLQWLPKSDPHYTEFKNDFQAMCLALLPLQRKDGFWNVSLKDPDHFGGKELTGTSLFTYGFAWGIKNGLLDKKRFFPAAVKAWNALVQDCVHADGMLGYVQGTGKEPKEAQPVSYTKIPDFEDFGLGCFLLAGSEIYQLARK